MTSQWAVFVTWKELFDYAPTEQEVLEVLRGFNRESTIVLLSRMGIHLFLDQFRQILTETIDLQAFLMSNFLDEDVLGRWRKRLPNEPLHFRRGFHSQQILTVLKWIILYALPIGGGEPDRDKEARYALGRCLLKTNDLLMSEKMAADIARDRRNPASPRRYLRLQLALGAGLQIFNPPSVPNGVVRGRAIFEDIAKRTPLPVDLSGLLEQQTGISLDSYVDLTFGALGGYMGRTPRDLIENAGLSVFNPISFFGPSVPTEIVRQFWTMESSTIDDFAKTLATPSELVSHNDFTAFRMKPFLQLHTGNVICPNPGFIQEKLEIGLFWTIVNNAQGEARQRAFDAWGKLFETYVNERFRVTTEGSNEQYFTSPEYAGRRHHHEAFDGFLISGRICAAIECKAGFLPNSAKYADDVDQFTKSLDQKFGAEPGAGVEQLARKIAYLFASKPAERRKLEGIDISPVDIIVPALVVQDDFVSSRFTLPWLASTFRSLMRKKSLDKRVVLTSLLVLHIEDVESIETYKKTGDFSLAECLLYAGKCGDPGLAQPVSQFSDLFRKFLEEKHVQPVKAGSDQRFHEILNRVTVRFFNKEFEVPSPDTQS
jgi:hypothetical protein